MHITGRLVYTAHNPHGQAWDDLPFTLKKKWCATAARLRNEVEDDRSRQEVAEDDRAREEAEAFRRHHEAINLRAQARRVTP